MASDLNQILPVAAGALLTQNQTLAQQQPARQHVPHTQQQISQITQIASAETATKPAKNDRERGTQVPKRPEAGFSSEEQNDQQYSPPSNDGARRLRAKA